MKISVNEIKNLVLHQLKNFFLEVDENAIINAIPPALEIIKENYYGLPNPRYFDGKEVIFSPHMTLHWMNFLYRLSHVLYEIVGGGNGRSSLLFE